MMLRVPPMIVPRQPQKPVAFGAAGNLAPYNIPPIGTQSMREKLRTVINHMHKQGLDDVMVVDVNIPDFDDDWFTLTYNRASTGSSPELEFDSGKRLYVVNSDGEIPYNKADYLPHSKHRAMFERFIYALFAAVEEGRTSPKLPLDLFHSRPLAPAGKKPQAFSIAGFTPANHLEKGPMKDLVITLNALQALANAKIETLPGKAERQKLFGFQELDWIEISGIPAKTFQTAAKTLGTSLCHFGIPEQRQQIASLCEAAASQLDRPRRSGQPAAARLQMKPETQALLKKVIASNKQDYGKPLADAFIALEAEAEKHTG